MYHVNLTTCMLADAARVGTDDGKLYIHGGRWDRLFAVATPITHPTMAIALVLELSWSEAFKNHVLDVALHDQDGKALGPRAVANVRVGLAADMVEGEPVTVPMAVTQQMVQFPTYGRYEWKIQFDGEAKGQLPITVARPPAMALPGFQLSAPSVPPPTEPEPES
jgi:hypothetical protein